MSGHEGALLTLEPLIEAVRDAAESAGWALSGLQKTTSHEYAGRWQGESARSAYLFFHRPAGEDGVSVECFLDETTRRLEGNLSLVLEGPTLAGLGDARATLAAVAAAAHRRLTPSGRARVSLKLRMDDAADPVDDTGTEIRVKLGVGEAALRAGADAVRAELGVALRAFERLLEDPAFARLGEGS